MSDIILLNNVRLSFPHLVEPQQQNEKYVSYNCDLILEENDRGFEKLLKRYSELALEKWKDHAQAIMNVIQNDRKKRCFGRGSEKTNNNTGLPYDSYAGKVYISAKSKTPPQMIQTDGSPIPQSNTLGYQQVARTLYAGCLVNAALKPWLQDSKDFGKGFRCELLAIQFAGDAESFTKNAPDTSSLFGAVANPTINDANSASMPAAPFQGLPSFLSK